MFRKINFILSLLLLMGTTLFAGDDSYKNVVDRLSKQALPKLKTKKIAVLPFEYIDKRTSMGSRVVAEKLTNLFVQSGKFTVIERSLVEKIIKELEFQLSAAIDPETAQKIGKGLGVEAIVTGTLSEVKRKKVEINARMVKTQTYEILAAAASTVHKSWSDQPPSETVAGTASSSRSQRTSSRGRSIRKKHGNIIPFFDFFLGISNSEMDLKFENNRFAITDTSELGIRLSTIQGQSTNANSVKFDGLKTGTSLPLGARIGMFSDTFGGSFEMSFFSHGVTSQRTTVTYDGISNGFRFTADEYLKVRVINILTGDFYVRLPTGDQIIPYVGLGLGMTINNVTSEFVNSLSGGAVSTPLDETSTGFTWRIPMGVRFRLSDQAGLFAEGRYYQNTFSFTRNIASENDTITLTGTQFLTGMSFYF